MGYADQKLGTGGRKGSAGPLSKLKNAGKSNAQVKPSNGGKPKKAGS